MAIDTPSVPLILRALAGEKTERPPIWLMRQAGRYLPEYRATREKAGGFLDLCYNPDLATEVTLQPIRRFGFDAAILFADILLIPQALGQKLWFVQGEGPRLEPIINEKTLKPCDEIHHTLDPVYETVKRVKESLPDDTALIGFAGSPWTVATYMIAGRGTPDQSPAHNLMKNDPHAFDAIMDSIINATIAYLRKQIDAGADVVKLFDSWAGSLKGNAFEKACLIPNSRIVSALRKSHPATPIIGFPRGVGTRALEFYQNTHVNCVAVDRDVSLNWIAHSLQPNVTVQGNLDQKLLVDGGQKLESETRSIIDALSDGPFIFNLGHGITPDADPKNVERLVRIVKG